MSTATAVTRATADREPVVTHASNKKGGPVCRSRDGIRSIVGNFLIIHSRGLRGFSILLFISALSLPVVAQHPYLWFDSTELALIRGKVASNTTDWQSLQTLCNQVAGIGSTPYAVQYPASTDSGFSSSTRGYVYNPPAARGTLGMGLGTGTWDDDMDELGACYQALGDTNPSASAAILAEVHYIVQAMAQPLVKLTSSAGQVRYGAAVDNYGNDLQAGDQIQVYLPYNTGTPGFSAGQTWTLSGETGCTAMNATLQVQSVTSTSVYFETPSGASAQCNAASTLYSVSPTASAAYESRFYMPAIAKAYDWFYSGLSASYPNDLTMLASAMTAWGTELGYAVASAHPHPEDNYHVGYIWGAAACYVAFNSDNSSLGSACSGIIASEFSNSSEFAQYHHLWMGGGGNGEGLAPYGYDSILRMLQAEYAMWDYLNTSGGSYGADWRIAPTNFTMLDDTQTYMMEFVTPSLLGEDGNEYVFPRGSVYCPGNTSSSNPCTRWFPTEPVYPNLSQFVFFATAAARMSSIYSAQFQDFYQSVYLAEEAAAGVTVPTWNKGPGNPYQSSPTPQATFLWYNPTAASSHWNAGLPLTYRGWGGNYATTRSAWSTTATVVRFLGGPTVGAAGNGKTQFDSGAVTIQTGNNRLLVYGLEEAARAADIISNTTFGTLQDERGTYGNKKNSVFWAGANPSETRNQGLTSRASPPGQTHTATSWPSSISLAEDKTSYSYFRSIHLEANGAKSSIDSQYHQVSWMRELVFLRPKLVIIHDLTTTLYPTDDRAMLWTFGRDVGQITSGVPSGMTRYDASFNGVYRGAFWSVLPAAADVTIVDHDDLHFLYRAEVRPNDLSHTADHWLAVFDAATSADDVNAVSSVSAINADAVQFNDANASIVAFASVDPHVATSSTLEWPINGSTAQYIVGLTPGATYGISTAGGNLTISSSGFYQASPAGVLVYSGACPQIVGMQRGSSAWLRHAIMCQCGSPCMKKIVQ